MPSNWVDMVGNETEPPGARKTPQSGSSRPPAIAMAVERLPTGLQICSARAKRAESRRRAARKRARATRGCRAGRGSRRIARPPGVSRRVLARFRRRLSGRVPPRARAAPRCAPLRCASFRPSQHGALTRCGPRARPSRRNIDDHAPVTARRQLAPALSLLRGRARLPVLGIARPSKPSADAC